MEYYRGIEHTHTHTHTHENKPGILLLAEHHKNTLIRRPIINE